eukprot:1143372-Pelagomonas_calceolata.AAC.3
MSPTSFVCAFRRAAHVAFRLQCTTLDQMQNEKQKEFSLPRICQEHEPLPQKCHVCSEALPHGFQGCYRAGCFPSANVTTRQIAAVPKGMVMLACMGRCCKAEPMQQTSRDHTEQQWTEEGKAMWAKAQDVGWIQNCPRNSTMFLEG